METKSIYEKLFRLQQEFKASKNQRNDFGKYNFRNIEQMLTELKPILKELGMIIVFSEEFINNNYLKSIIKLIDIESGDEYHTSSICAIDSDVKGMSNSQATGCALTYSRKYTLQALLAIDDGKSDPDSMDGNNFNKGKTTQNKIDGIVEQINDCSSIDELTSLWNKIGNWTKNETVKQTFTAKKKILKNF